MERQATGMNRRFDVAGRNFLRPAACIERSDDERQMNALFMFGSMPPGHSAGTLNRRPTQLPSRSQTMLKKTLLATTTISATLFAVAAVLPTFAQSRGGETSSAPTPTAQTPVRAPAQDRHQANDDVREWPAAAAMVGAGTKDAVRSTTKDAHGDARSEDRHGPERRLDHDRSRD